MKTKKILGTLALAALAAACSNEEFEAVSNSPELKGRVDLGQISLTMGDADTRWTVGEGANFNNLYAEEGDEVGACLIDVYSPNANNELKNADAKYNYVLSNYIQTNYSFKKGSGAEWVSEAKMVEGNYVFYAPYNANHNTRKPLTVKFNPVQQLAKAADGSIDAVSTIKELKESGEIMAVSHKFIAAADGKSVSTNLLPIYAYPLVTLKNSYKETPVGGTTAVATDVVINQIVIYKGDGSFVTEGTLKFAAAADGTAVTEVATESAKSVVAKLGTFEYPYKDGSNWKTGEAEGEKNWKNGANENYTADLITASEGKTTSAIVVKAPESAWTLKAGESTKFHVVMPAAKYTNNLFIQVYTNKGVFTLKGTEANGFTGTIAAGKRYAADEYNPDGTLKQPAEAGMAEAGDTYKVVFGTPTDAAESIVATTADLVTLINNTEASKVQDGNVVANTLNVKPLNRSVEVNAAVVSAIKAKDFPGFTVNFTAAPTISASVASANKNIVFKAGAYVTSGTITLGQHVLFESATNDPKSVLSVTGGDVTLDEATFTVEKSEIQNNGGNLIVKSAFTTLTNYSGNVSLPVKNIGGSLVNFGGSITLGDGQKDGENDKTFNNGIANYIGTLTVTANTSYNGTISTNGVMLNAEGEVVNENGTEYKATIENNGTIAAITTNRSKGVINNYGTLENVATSNGFIDLKSASAKVTTGAGTGRVNNTVDAAYVNCNADQAVYYEFTSDVTGNLTPETAVYNTIVLNGMTWKPNVSQTLPEEKNMELKGATISVYTEGLEIVIQGTMTVKSTSYMKGSANSKIFSTEDLEKDDSKNKKLFISGVKYYKNANNSGGTWSGTEVTTSN